MIEDKLIALSKKLLEEQAQALSSQPVTSTQDFFSGQTSLTLTFLASCIVFRMSYIIFLTKSPPTPCSAAMDSPVVHSQDSVFGKSPYAGTFRTAR
jgi:hypothetical protein